MMPVAETKRLSLSQQMSGLVTDYMEVYGTKFAWKCVPKRVDRLPSGGLQVTWTETPSGKEHKDTYDSVLWAVGESECWLHHHKGEK